MLAGMAPDRNPTPRRRHRAGPVAKHIHAGITCKRLAAILAPDWDPGLGSWPLTCVLAHLCRWRRLLPFHPR
jgi:hypothetical protein